MNETSASPTGQPLERHAHSLQRAKEMGEAQRTFDEHTGYGLYFARIPAGG